MGRVPVNARMRKIARMSVGRSIERLGGNVMHRVIERGGAVVKREHGRHEHDARHACQARHVVDVNGAEGRLAHHEHQAALLFHLHVGRAQQQVFAAAACDAGERLHGARDHDHAVDRIGAACDGGADVLVVVYRIGIARKLIERHAELLLDGDLSPARDDKRRLGTGLTQAFEALEAQRSAAGTRNANDNATRTDRRLRHGDSLTTW